MQSPGMSSSATTPAAVAAAMSTPATDELRHLLSNPSGGNTATAVTAAYAALQNLRDSGDPTFLFLRTLVELTSLAPLPPQMTQSGGIRGDEVELMFHCATGLRDVLLARWEGLPPTLTTTVRDHLLFVGLYGWCSFDNGMRQPLPRVVRTACLSASAAFWKRGWLEGMAATENGTAAAGGGGAGADNTGMFDSLRISMLEKQRLSQPGICNCEPINSPADLFSRVETAVLRPLQVAASVEDPAAAQRDHAAAVMGCFFLSELTSEFAGGGGGGGGGAGSSQGSGANAGVTRYHMSLEFHRLSRRSFESSPTSPVGLDSCLSIAMRALAASVQSLTAAPNGGGDPFAVLNPNSVELAGASASLVTSVLSWEFGGGSSFSSSAAAASAVAASAAQTSALLRPPKRWREWIVRPDVLRASFDLHSSLRRRLAAAAAAPPHRGGDAGGLEELAHRVRQLLLSLSSVSGPIYRDFAERAGYAGFLLDGCLSALSETGFVRHRHGGGGVGGGVVVQQQEEEEWRRAELVDLCQMMHRLAANYRVSVLSRLPPSSALAPSGGTPTNGGQQQQQHLQQQQQQQPFVRMLVAVAETGTELLRRNVAECEGVVGDVEAAGGIEWRDEALDVLLDAAVQMADDRWIVPGGKGGEAGVGAAAAISEFLSPLYTTYVSGRIQLSRMEEHYIARTHADLDEVREEISASDLEEQLLAASSLGRTNMPSSVSCLSSMVAQCLPRLRALFEAPTTNPAAASGIGRGGGEITPDGAALLEEARLLVEFVSHLLTDDADGGETPLIPEAIVNACGGGATPGSGAVAVATTTTTTDALCGLVSNLMSLAEFQASRIAVSPEDPRLSPLLGATLLRLFARWAPAYVLPSPDDYSAGPIPAADGGILATWASPDSSQRAVSFCATLCLHYFCFWPQEGQVQDGAASLLLSLARRRGPTRGVLVHSCPAFEQLLSLHVITSGGGIWHNSSRQEVDAAIASAASADAALPSRDMVRGYQRLPYDNRARILTALLLGCSEPDDARAFAMLSRSLEVVRSLFSSLVQALNTKQINSQDIRAHEVAMLCVEMYGGIARSSEMSQPERIPQFLTPFLSDLSGLMIFYAEDLAICEGLLVFFRDYAEQFIAMLTRDQCLALFTASADLLKCYSSQHCSTRVVKSGTASKQTDGDEEEQNYNDVLCAIQLLIHLGTKDFIDICSVDTTNDDGTKGGVESSQITDVIFYGLQQILPLMSKGLLQFPTLCTQYFSLVGFMVDTYPEKVCELPYDLFSALLDSLLFGMSHTDSFVAKNSLRGIGALATEHIKTKALTVHLSQHWDVFDRCSSRLLQEVVFQSIVWDRMEATGIALLPLVAVDMNRFAALVNAMSQQLGSVEKQQRLQGAFERLLSPDVITKVVGRSAGYEGRMIRIKFRKDFETFVKDVHSFLILK